jgi:hypothetical protein
MARQLRFDTPEELATKIIDKLSQEELHVTTRALIVHVHAQIPVKELEKTVAASNNAVVETVRKPKVRQPQASPDKMWLYQAKKGWALSNLSLPVERVVQRLQNHYGCKILATKEGKINFLPSKPTTIDELQKNGFVVYRQDLNKKAA